MGWREAFESMDECQRRRFAIMADCRGREGDKPDRVAAWAATASDGQQGAYLSFARAIEADALIRAGDRQIGATVGRFPNLVDANAMKLLILAERRGIDLDPIADAVLMGEEREFLDRITPA